MKRCAKKQPKIKIGKRDESSFWSKIVYHSPPHLRLSRRISDLTHSVRESKGTIVSVGNLWYRRGL